MRRNVIPSMRLSIKMKVRMRQCMKRFVPQVTSSIMKRNVKHSWGKTNARKHRSIQPSNAEKFRGLKANARKFRC